MAQKCALILGSTKGLGKCIRDLCQNNGMFTIQVGSSLRDNKTKNALMLHCDLSDLKSVQSLIDKLDRTDLEVDHFFWVAGTILKGNLQNQNRSHIIKTIDVNFRNSVLLAHWFYQRWNVSTEAKTMTVISSTSGTKPRKDEAVYVATKFAQTGFTRSLGIENINPNFKISLFLPGGMQTSLWDKNPQPDFNSFLKPEIVAKLIFEKVLAQVEPYLELEIPRGGF